MSAGRFGAGGRGRGGRRSNSSNINERNITTAAQSVNEPYTPTVGIQKSNLNETDEAESDESSANDWCNSSDDDDDNGETVEGESIERDDPQGEFNFIDAAELGNEQHTLKYSFHCGDQQSYQSLERYKHMSDIDIVLSLSSQFFQTLKDCSNQQSTAANITTADLYLYHAFLTLRSLLPLPRIESYWNPDEHMLRWDATAALLFESLPLHRLQHIRNHLKGCFRDDIGISSSSSNNNSSSSNNKGWEVVRAINSVQQTFRAVLSHPGECLSVDEVIAKATAKTAAGIRFFLLCDCETNLVVNFVLDNKPSNASSSSNSSSSGAVAQLSSVDSLIVELCETATLPGQCYKILADSCCCTVQLAERLLSNRQITLCGIMNKKNTPPLVHFTNNNNNGNSNNSSNGNSYNSSAGVLRIAKKANAAVYVYSFMESNVGFYFLDSMTGPGVVGTIRKPNNVATTTTTTTTAASNANSAAAATAAARASVDAATNCKVPAAVARYDRFSRGKRVFDQVINSFGCRKYSSDSYTLRALEVLFSMILTQAFNIRRYCCRSTGELAPTETQFKSSVIEGFLSQLVVPQFAAAAATAATTTAATTTTATTTAAGGHQLLKFAAGSRADGTNRRRMVCCRSCSNRVAGGKRNSCRRTCYYCDTCQVGFHAVCFGPFHAQHINGSGEFHIAKKLKL